MLELKYIKKTYVTGEFSQHALKDFSLKFRKSEFVAVLGPSGSGKTTLLNIIGGLDRYTSGDLIINQKSTKNFKDRDWDSYRNNCVGFIFQSYNLISHISVLDNVEMGMTLSGVSKKERRRKALEVLDKVGLKDHAHKKPNQLSGGQMQRVAIARALANDPEIILADEPTGALDSATSVQIMELIKEIAKDKLVIMVTHNNELAETYASRVVRMRDGEIMSDSDPVDDMSDQKSYNIRKTAMSFLTALKLSFNNIQTKKGRTLLTAFASSIGIIGIALILSLSNGFDIQIDKFETETLSSFPVMITEQATELDASTMMEIRDEAMNTREDYPSENKVYPYDTLANAMLHTNKITSDYVDYVNEIDKNLITGIAYTHVTGLNLLNKVDGEIKPVMTSNSSGTSYFASLPIEVDNNMPTYLEKNYDVLAGSFPTDMTDLVLLVDSKNRVDTNLLKLLGIDTSKEEISFDELLGLELKLVLNDDYYRNLGDYFTLNNDYQAMYESENTITLTITGIIRGKEDNKLTTSGSTIGYTEELVSYIIEQNQNSAIVEKQQEANYNVLTGEQLDLSTEEGEKTKQQLLAYLGADTLPYMISIYPVDFDSKEQILDYLDGYNENKESEDQIIYTDLAATVSSLSGSIMDAITYVLIAFSAISLVVSSIMIGIITYISVLERTKEIGVLRALGARKKDITRVFNAETFIIGLCSGILGIGIAWLLTFPMNMLLESLTDLPNVAQLNPIHALILALISISLTLIGGYIPAKIASKKDPVVALRTE